MKVKANRRQVLLSIVTDDSHEGNRWYRNVVVVDGPNTIIFGIGHAAGVTRYDLICRDELVGSTNGERVELELTGDTPVDVQHMNRLEVCHDCGSPMTPHEKAPDGTAIGTLGDNGLWIRCCGCGARGGYHEF